MHRVDPPWHSRSPKQHALHYPSTLHKPRHALLQPQSSHRPACPGNAHSFDTTMPRMLQALSGVQPDLSKHVIITAIGGLAWRLCGSVMNNGGHEGHCALDKYLKAPDGPVSWGTNW